MKFVHQYFDAAQKVDVKKYEDPQFPEQTAMRTAVMKDDNVRSPGILYGFPIPAYRSPDHYALEIAATILGSGESSRLHQLLVRDKAVAQEVGVGTDDRRGPDLFTIDAKLADGAKVGDVEKQIEGEVKALGQRGPSDAEIAKAHRRVQAEIVLGLQSNLARARKLGEFETYFGDARLLNAELPKYLAVTKDDVKRVVASYLGPTKRTIVETYPSAPPAKSDGAKSEKSDSTGGAKSPGAAPAKGSEKKKPSGGGGGKPKKK
jgi:predicted Zn-dependent peptidase